MNRPLIYSGEIPRSTDMLYGFQQSMLGLAKLAHASFGSTTLAVGLGCAPTNPASMSVAIAPGHIYQMQSLEATAYGVLGADTNHSILKQGTLLDAVNLSCPAPATSGNSINYLIQATYQDSDAQNVVLPYYNSANPSQPFSGPANNGTAQATQRNGVVTISAKAGAAAATGSQTTPAPDAGYVGLYVVTVANGATTITAGNISQVAGAPILSNLLSLIQTDSAVYASDIGAANAYVANPTPGNGTLVDGMRARFKAANANTGACTLNWSGTGVKTLQGMSGALQGGEILAGQTYDCVWSAGLAAWVLVGQTGGALQVANAGRSQQSAALGQTLAAAGIQDVKASRAVGTVYTNSLARPIFVMIAASVTTAGDAAMMVVGGVNVVGSSAASTGPACTVGAMVPPGATYNLTSANNGTAGISTILTWVEDR